MQRDKQGPPDAPLDHPKAAAQAQGPAQLATQFRAAQEHHLAGRLDRARSLYHRVLSAAPGHVESLMMLASIAHREGDQDLAHANLDRAIDLSRGALTGAPNNHALRASLANLLLARGHQRDAEAELARTQIPLNPIRADAETFERRRASAQEKGLPAILMSTLPKSASESIWNKLTQGLGMAQCHFSLGLFPDCTLVPSRVRAVASGGVIAKEHLAPTAFNLGVLAESGLDRVLVHIRDPRQATLSWVHFARDDINKRLLAPLWRKIVPPGNVVSADLGTQIEWCLESYLPHLIRFVEDWIAVAEQAPTSGPSVQFMTFESYLQDPDDYFARALDFCGIDPGQFAPEAEAEVVHLRKGRIDEWREVFSQPQRTRAWELIPRELADRFGWQR